MQNFENYILETNMEAKIESEAGSIRFQFATGVLKLGYLSFSIFN